MTVFICEKHIESLEQLFSNYGLHVVVCLPKAEIPGSYWGPPEAGLISNSIYLRGDTPIHSALHEASHFVCMTHARRCNLLTDAGGDDIEESAVCFLQVLLADYIPRFGRQQCLADMDEWGYTFRFKSACYWFEHDAEDASSWLTSYGLLDEFGNPNWCLRH